MRFGIDHLGGARYKDTVLRYHPRSFAAGFFSNTFGDAVPVADALASIGIPEIRLHLMWKDAHDYNTNDIPAVVKEAKRILPLVLKHPGTEWRISPCCEHKLKAADALKFFTAIGAVFTDKVVYVNSPSTGATLPTACNEFHGTKATGNTPRMDFSFDGNNCFDADVEGEKNQWARTETFYLWTSRCNGKAYDAEPTPRPQRHNWPSQQIIESMIYLTTIKGSVSLPNGWTLKSHSEDKGTGDSRANKPVILAPTTASFLEVKTRDGHTVDHITRYSTPYSDGRNRYYSTTWGYQTGQKAIAIQGDAVTELWANGHKVGTCNMGFRQGSYHD